MPQPNSSPAHNDSGDNFGDNSRLVGAGENSATPPGGPERELLEQVVRRTLTEQGDSGLLPSGLLGELKDIARSDRELSQTWEATVPKLIQQILASLFPVKSLELQVRREMAQEIAETLLHDENAAPRLRRFCDRICDGDV
jgi:hypothetical protein